MINEPILAAHLLLLLPLLDGNVVNSIDSQCGSPCALFCLSGFGSSIWNRARVCVCVCVCKSAPLLCYIWSKPVWNELSCLSGSGLLLQRFSIWACCVFLTGVALYWLRCLTHIFLIFHPSVIASSHSSNFVPYTVYDYSIFMQCKSLKVKCIISAPQATTKWIWKNNFFQTSFFP